MYQPQAVAPTIKLEAYVALRVDFSIWLIVVAFF
jgi:hypothetical protein